MNQFPVFDKCLLFTILSFCKLHGGGKYMIKPPIAGDNVFQLMDAVCDAGVESVQHLDSDCNVDEVL